MLIQLVVEKKPQVGACSRYVQCYVYNLVAMDVIIVSSHRRQLSGLNDSTSVYLQKDDFSLLYNIQPLHK